METIEGREFNEYVFNGKSIVPGTEFAVQGEIGARFHFLNHVVLVDGTEWINCIGGKSGHHMFRSFRPTRITRITKQVPVNKPARSA